MTKKLSHTAKQSQFGKIWKLLMPVIPDSLRSAIRRNGQYIYSRKLEQTDSMLISYPKSGSTWLRDMVANLIAGSAIPAEDLAKWVPPLHMARNEFPASPRVVRSHDKLSTIGFKKAGKHVILVRDPRALVVSWAFHQKRRGENLTIEEATDSLLNEGFLWLGSWKSHHQYVISQAEQSTLKIIRYEDLHGDTEQVLAELAEFLELNCSEIDIKRAIQDSTPNALRSRRVQAGLEKENEKHSDIRKASKTSWREECPQTCIDRIEKALESELKHFGYELT